MKTFYSHFKTLLLSALILSLSLYGCSRAVVVSEKPMTQAEKELAAEKAAAEARAKAESDAAAVAMQEEEGVKVKKKKKSKPEKTPEQKAAEQKAAADAKAKKKAKETKKAVWAGGVVVDDKANGNNTNGNNANANANTTTANSDPSNPSNPSFTDLYGNPTVNYVVKGKVVNSAGKPIQGMQVLLVNENLDITPLNVNLHNDSIRAIIEQCADTTKADGSFKVKTENIATDYMRVFLRDIDGPSHGNWENQVINISFDDSDTKDTGHGWRAATKQKKLTIKAKPRR